MRSKKSVIFFMMGFILSGLTVLNVHAAEDPFKGLIDYLCKQYANPYEIVGKVNETSKSRILFIKKDHKFETGRRLWVVDHKKGISPPLQERIATIRVDAVFSETVLARVEELVGRQIEQKDLVLIPPVPLIHFYTNIEDKHAFPPYQKLLRSLLDAHFQVMEVTEDTILTKPGEDGLILRLEGEAGHLICLLTPLPGNRVLYSESLAEQGAFQISFDTGHTLNRLVPRLVNVTAAPAAEIPPSAITAPRKTIKHSFQRPEPVEKTDFYRLPEPYFRVVTWDPDGIGQQDLAFLGEDGLVIYRLENGQLVEKIKHEFKKKYFPLHLHKIDLDGDGGQELLVTLAEKAINMDKEDNRLVSQIVSFKKGQLQTLVHDWPYYLRVIKARNNKCVALAQAGGAYDQYSGPVYRVLWNKTAKKVETGSIYKPANNIHSIYQFNLIPGDLERVIILEPSADLHGYFTPTERVESSGERNYGNYMEIAYPIKLEKDVYVGGFDKKTSQEIYVPRRFEIKPEFDNQAFLLYKERRGGIVGMVSGGLKKLVGYSHGIDQVVGVKWIEKRILETWQSRKLTKDVIDFTFLKDPARIMILYRDGDGYALEGFY